MHVSDLTHKALGSSRSTTWVVQTHRDKFRICDLPRAGECPCSTDRAVNSDSDRCADHLHHDVCPRCRGEVAGIECHTVAGAVAHEEVDVSVILNLQVESAVYICEARLQRNDWLVPPIVGSVTVHIRLQSEIAVCKSTWPPRCRRRWRQRRRRRWRRRRRRRQLGGHGVRLSIPAGAPRIRKRPTLHPSCCAP